jgi:16S rRNA (cytosine967-C5)-methyltransferase
VSTGAQVMAAAARAVHAVLADGTSSEQALARHTGSAPRAAVQAVVLGTLRWYLRLAPAVLPLAGERNRLEPILRALLAVAAHQLEYSEHAPAATVAAAVDAARLLGQPRAAGLVNAVLRRLLRERAACFRPVDARATGRNAHPEWLVRELARAWPAQCEAVQRANNAHPPLTLRVDATRSSVAAQLAALAGDGIAASEVAGVPTAITLAEPVPVERIPGFAAGVVSVQDSSAQLAALLLAPRAGELVLDACAAPGGKSGALLEAAGGTLDLTALDIDAGRLARVQENLARLGRSARLVAADLAADMAADATASVTPGANEASAPAGGWWDGRPFAAILLDAPCSGTGVIRRHPDIKLLRRANDIAPMAARQLQLLRAAFALLAPGGRLLYCTCSVLPAENAAVVRAFLAGEPAAQELDLPVPWPAAVGLHRAEPGWQRLTGEGGGDGFYYALLGRALRRSTLAP